MSSSSLQRLPSQLVERVSSVFERQRSGVETPYIARSDSNRSTVSRAEAEKRGESHVTTARSWKGSDQLHDEATAPWVVPSCVQNPLTATEQVEDAKRRAATAAAFLDSIQRSSAEAPAVVGDEPGACFMSALLSAHSSGRLHQSPPPPPAPPARMQPATPVVPVPVPPTPTPVLSPPIPSPAPSAPPAATAAAVKRERSVSGEATPAGQPPLPPAVEEQPAEKKAPRVEAPKNVPAPTATTATKPAPKASKSKKTPIVGQMKLNFSKIAPVAAAPHKATPAVAAQSPPPPAQIVLPPAPPPISSENDELYMPDETEFENQTVIPHAEVPRDEVAGATYQVREGEHQAEAVHSSVNDDLVMGIGLDEEPTPKPQPTDAFGALMGRPQSSAAGASASSKSTSASVLASSATLKQSTMMGALFNPALVAFQKQFEKRTKNLIKRRPDGSVDVQQITIRVKLGPVKDGKPTILEEMTEEEYRQQCDVVIQKNKAVAATNN